MEINNLSLLMYTNETYLPIAKLSIDEFNKYSNGINIKKYLVSNFIPEEIDLSTLGFELISSNTQLSSESRHFSEVLIHALEKISDKYVLFFLDDTMVINQIKGENLNSLVKLMDENNINHLSLMSYGHDWEVLNVDYAKYNLPNDLLFNLPGSYLYKFSLQPSIWEVSSLMEILKHNKGISLHEFDTSYVKNKRGELRHGSDEHGKIPTPPDFWDYGFKHTCFKRTYENTQMLFDDRPFEGDYFLFLYLETIRGGKFNLHTHRNNRIYLDKFLSENEIDVNHEVYHKYF